MWRWCGRTDDDARYAQQLEREEMRRRREGVTNEEDMKLAEQLEREEHEQQLRRPR